jgi:lipopolysaccharide export LptBFGC system permease protein LptF
MKTRSFIFCAFALLFGFALTVFADIVWHTPEERSQNMLQAFTKALDLSLEQQSQLKPMLWDHINAQDILRQEYTRKARAEEEATDQKIAAVLTTAQKDKYPQVKQNLQDHSKELTHTPSEGSGRHGNHF